MVARNYKKITIYSIEYYFEIWEFGWFVMKFMINNKLTLVLAVIVW